jgi:transcriptional regulator with XRE-family HTH domain
MTLGNIIKQYRENNKMSQRQFAIACDVSNGYISMLEEGRNPKTNEPIVPSLVTLRKLARAMHMSVDELMIAADEMEISLADVQVKKASSTRLTHSMEAYSIARAALAEPTLTEAEQLLLDLFRQIPEEKQQLFLQMGRLYADSLKKD